MKVHKKIVFLHLAQRPLSIPFIQLSPFRSSISGLCLINRKDPMNLSALGVCSQPLWKEAPTPAWKERGSQGSAGHLQPSQQTDRGCKKQDRGQTDQGGKPLGSFRKINILELGRDGWKGWECWLWTTVENKYIVAWCHGVVLTQPVV